MLRISYFDTGARQRWKVCGQLAGEWVDELRSCWQYARKGTSASESVLDLSDVTFIDEAGERLLADMRIAGVEFVAAGVETRHLLDNLQEQGEKPLRRLIGRCK